MSQTPWQYDNVYRCKEILKSVCHALAYVTIVNRLRVGDLAFPHFRPNKAGSTRGMFTLTVMNQPLNQ